MLGNADKTHPCISGAGREGAGAWTGVIKDPGQRMVGVTISFTYGANYSL